MQAQWQIGDRIKDRWEVHKIIRGGMGIVYIVYDHEGGGAFALKTFRDKVLDHNPDIAGSVRSRGPCLDKP
jgi:hypothetical protein